MTLHRSALLFALSTVAACAPAATDAQTVAFTNATIIDGTGAPPRPAMTVLVRDGRITAVQPASVALTRDVVVRDLSGKYVIPGLIDAHVHLGTRPRDPGMMEAVLRNVFMGGVTAVRDMGGRYDIVKPLADKGSSDTVPMPRVRMAAIMSGAGEWIEGERGSWYAAGAPLGESPTIRRLRTASDVVPAVTAAKAAGAHGIKIYNTIDPSLVRAVADEARRQGLRVWSHLWVDPGAPSGVLEARAEVVSHADMWVAELIADSVRRRMTDQYRTVRATVYADTTALDRPAAVALLQTMKAQGTIVDPTLFVMTPRRDSLGRLVVRPGTLEAGAIEFVRRAHRAGIDVAAGTDAIGGSTPNLHVELQILTDLVGMTPLEAIRSATSVNARALGLDDTGVIAPGKRADLVILDADPSVDIANTITVSAVVKAGRVYTREKRMTTPPGARPPR